MSFPGMNYFEKKNIGRTRKKKHSRRCSKLNFRLQHIEIIPPLSPHRNEGNGDLSPIMVPKRTCVEIRRQHDANESCDEQHSGVIPIPKRRKEIGHKGGTPKGKRNHSRPDRCWTACVLHKSQLVALREKNISRTLVEHAIKRDQSYKQKYIFRPRWQVMWRHVHGIPAKQDYSHSTTVENKRYFAN